uniref:AB hydrolase-1 domain-containing protein n=1 Tax=Lotus japonicus TaxID=34305 RepID=I3SY80_LOTJA|nr:unknown [Lotus japonicus]
MDRKHYVLVHGACHGAWCWYKVKPRLESAGHKVTVIDLAASGINMKKIEEVDTISQYSEPLLQLMASIPSNKKVILVGHSLGGLNISLAMDKFPEKFNSIPAADWLDAEFLPCGNKKSIVFGPKFLVTKLYQLSPAEDHELAKALMRTGSLFVEDMIQQKNMFKQGYGLVPRVFIICTEDLTITLKFQLWMIQNAGINEVIEMKGADHMPMLCKPQELSDSLLQIATKYAN